MKRNFLRFVWKEWESSRDRDLKGERQEVLKHEDDMIDDIRYIFQTGLTYKGLYKKVERYRPMQEIQAVGGYSMFTGEEIRKDEEVEQFLMY